MSFKAIAITAFKRPQYFEEMLQSLIKNDLTDWRVYIQLEPSSHHERFLEIAERLLKPYNYSITVNTTRLGVKYNPYHMLENVFNSGAMCCIYLEEDLIVSPDLIKLANWYLAQDLRDVLVLNLLSGGCCSAGFISNPNEPNKLFKAKTFNSLGLVIIEQQWQQHFKVNWLRTPKHALTKNGLRFDGWDLAIFDYLLASENLYVLQPIFARASHIGKDNATHTTPEFQKHAFESLEIYSETDHELIYEICDDQYQLTYPIRSHINLRQELNDTLITLKDKNREHQTLIKKHDMLVNENLLQFLFRKSHKYFVNFKNKLINVLATKTR